MAILWNQIGDNEEIARRVLVQARSIAPCLDSFPDDSEQQKDAIAVLKGVYDGIAADLKSRGGFRHLRSQRVGTAGVSYDIGSAFSADDRDALAALCAAAAAAASIADRPEGHFPKRHLPISLMWPERY